MNIVNKYKFTFYFASKISKTNKENIIKYFSIQKVLIDDNNYNIVIVIGGDGTFLQAIQKYGCETKYIFLSTGKIGFYKTVNLESILNNQIDFWNIIENNFLEKIVLLKICFNNQTSYALNEVRVGNLSKALYIDIFFNNALFKKNYGGSGIYISTAYGSTGFNSSYNGPWLSNQSDFIFGYLEPLNNKNFHSYENKLIYNSNTAVKLILSGPRDNYLIFDNSTFKINTTEITISKSNKTINIYRLDKDFNKLWYLNIANNFK